MADFTFTPLNPAGFLDRSREVFADRVAVVDGDVRWTYAELGDRVDRATGALAAMGVGRGDPVGLLCTNSSTMLELHHAVPLRGAVLVPLNIRASTAEITYMLRHCRAKALVATAELADVAEQVATDLGLPMLVAAGPDSSYESALDAGVPARTPLSDERGVLGINYTSGTTGPPKGAVYHLRGAYLQSLAMALHARLTDASVYLWTLPMFHCNGWCFTWAVTAAGGTHHCHRSIEPAEVWMALREHRVTHLCAAPTVLTMIAAATEAVPLEERVWVGTGGAPPTPQLLGRLESLGLDVTHLYGMTETFGPVIVNSWRSEWDDLPPLERARLKARQGVGNVIADRPQVLADDGTPVPRDGATVGELALRGNDLMLGYLDDEGTTTRSTTNGHFRTGDLAVMHPDGYVELRDRRKDIIISGGENIASVEVERTITTHPAVLECAVVGRPDDVWGEVPVAYVTLHEGATATVEELIEHCRQTLARYKVPRHVVFGQLPKTSTGKIQKQALRAREQSEPAPSPTPSQETALHEA